MLILVVAAVIQTAQPIGPAPQVIEGFGNIPEMRGGPIVPHPGVQLSGVDWVCDISLDGGRGRLEGRIEALDPLPDGADPLQLAQVPVVITRSSISGWQGEFDATVTAPTGSRIYAFQFRHGEDAYDLVVRFPRDLTGPGRIAIAKNNLDNVVGQGDCRVSAS